MIHKGLLQEADGSLTPDGGMTLDLKLVVLLQLCPDNCIAFTCTVQCNFEMAHLEKEHLL